MGCLYNEVRRGLCLTMEAKGVRSGLNCVRREDEACGAWRCYSRLCALVRSRYSRGGGRAAREEKQIFFLKEEQKRVFPVGCLPPAAPNWNHQTPAELTSDILSSIEIVNIQEKHSTHKFAFYAIDSTGSHCVPALTEALVQNKLGLIETKLIRL